MLKKKIWDNFQRIIELFTKKFVTKLSKIWGWDPESEIRDLEKIYSRSRRIQPGSRIPDPDPQHCIAACTVCMYNIYAYTLSFVIKNCQSIQYDTFHSQIYNTNLAEEQVVL